MANRRALTPAQVHSQDVITPMEILEIAALRHAARSDGKLPRRVARRLRDSGLSVEQATLYSKLLFTDALMAQDKAISLMWETKDPSTLRMALAAAIDAKDRVMGRPTERVQVASHVTVVFQGGGLDPNRLPSPTNNNSENVLDVPAKEKPDDPNETE